MKRKIKFRAWDKEYKKFLYNDPHISLDLHGNIFNLQNGEGNNIYELSQFTGLKDRNGKEIFEGDVIKDIEGSIGWVIYKSLDNVAEYFITTDGLDGWYFWDSEPIEVIGNIYENPELINITN